MFSTLISVLDGILASPNLLSIFLDGILASPNLLSIFLISPDDTSGDTTEDTSVSIAQYKIMPYINTRYFALFILFSGSMYYVFKINGKKNSNIANTN